VIPARYEYYLSIINKDMPIRDCGVLDSWFIKGDEATRVRSRLPFISQDNILISFRR
jgi:hypothetical protein